MCHDKCDQLVFIQVVLIRIWRVFLVLKFFFLGYGELLYYSFCFDASRSSAYTLKKFYELYEV
jgi:hypothetical protein